MTSPPSLPPRTWSRGVLGLLAAIRLVFNTAHRFVYPFLPAIARGLGVSLDRAGLLVSARWFAGLATPLVVRGVGRAARRRLAMVGLGMFAVGAAITATVGGFAGAMVGFVAMGLGKPAFDVAVQAYVADRVDYARRARALSVLEFTWAGGLLVGAPLAGVLIDAFGWRAPFWFFAAAAIAGAMAVARRLDADEAGPDTVVPRMRGGRALWVAAALFTLGAEVLFVVFGAWLEDAFGLALLALGGLAFLIGLAELTGEGATFGFTDRLGKKRAVGVGMVVAAAGFFGVALWSDALVPGLVAIAIGLAGFEFTIVSTVPLATEIAADARTPYLAGMAVVTGVARGIGSAVGPPIYEAWGVSANAAIAALVNLLALAVLVMAVHDRTAVPMGGSDVPE